jgi:hypothetical protein
MSSKSAYYNCVIAYYSLRPIGNIEFATVNVTGSPGCFSGPIEYRAGGYLEGVGGFLFFTWGGTEMVYNFATMESHQFDYAGPGVNDSFIGGGISAYTGVISGFRSDTSIDFDYEGPFLAISGGVGLDIGQIVGAGTGLVGFVSTGDFRLYGVSGYIGGGISLDLIPGLEVGGAILFYYGKGSYTRYAADGTHVNRTLLLQDINSGYQSPWPFFIESTAAGQASRILAKLEALQYADIYEEIHNAK